MKQKYQNIFFLIGVVAIVIMLFSFDISYRDLWHNLQRAGWWFFAVVLIWVPQYLLNAMSWGVILREGTRKNPMPFLKLLKYTISGYSLNYVTPIGLLGGEPYRIMVLTPYVGGTRATSSVILYAMMHIFSHFVFWAFSILLYIVLYVKEIHVLMAVFLILVASFCSLGIYFFMKGYRNGLAMKTLHFIGHIPGLKRWSRKFIETRRDKIEEIDSQISELHAQSRKTFYLSLFLEFSSRVVGCMEIWFIFMILTDTPSFWNCILIQAFTSLFANIFFFMPMELGAREGGFALAVGGLSMSGAFGVFAGLLTRVRELIWIVIGIGLMKIGENKTKQCVKDE